MNIFNTKFFEEIINREQVKCENQGPFYSEIKKITLKRDNNCNLLAEVTPINIRIPPSYNYPEGTVREADNSNSIHLVHKSENYRVTLYGVSPRSAFTGFDQSNGAKQVIKSTVHFIEASLGDPIQGRYFVEWLENIDSKPLHWPESLEYNKDEGDVIKIGTPRDVLEIPFKSSYAAICGSCVIYIEVNGVKVYLIFADKNQSTDKESGYLIYLGCPDKELRDRIRESISFFIGRPLVKTGHSILDKDWNLLALRACSPYTKEGLYFKLPTLPPTILSEKCSDVIDSKIFSYLINTTCNNYVSYDFQHLFRLYWEASCQSYSSPVLFNGCIEFLFQKVIKNGGSQVNNCIVEKDQWEKLKGALIVKIEEFKEITREQKCTLIQKVKSSLNQPLGKKTIFEDLNLELNSLERSVHDIRNQSAHGDRINNDGSVETFRKIKVFKLLFHRVLFSILGIQYYFDYYSIGYPVKSIHKGVGDDD